MSNPPTTLIPTIRSKGACVLEEVPIVAPAGRVIVDNELSLVSPGTELAMFLGTHQELANPAFPWVKYPFRCGYAAVGKVRGGPRVAHGGHHGAVSMVTMAMCHAIEPEAEAQRMVFQRLVQIAMTAPFVAPAEPGQTVVVIGAGLIGNLAAQVYRELGAGRVWVAERLAARRATAGACGLAVLPLADTLAGSLRAAGVSAPDLIVDAVAASTTVTEALDAVADFGRVVLLGSPRQPASIDLYAKIHLKCARLIGAHERARGQEQIHRDAPFVLDALRHGRIHTAPLVTDHIRLEELPGMYDRIVKHPDQHLGVLIHY